MVATFVTVKKLPAMIGRPLSKRAGPPLPHAPPRRDSSQRAMFRKGLRGDGLNRDIRQRSLAGNGTMGVNGKPDHSRAFLFVGGGPSGRRGAHGVEGEDAAGDEEAFEEKHRVVEIAI